MFSCHHKKIKWTLHVFVICAVWTIYGQMITPLIDNMPPSLQLLGLNELRVYIMGAKASQITSLTIVYSSVYSGANQRKHQSSASLAFVRGIHRWSVNSQHKGPVTRKMFPFDDVIMVYSGYSMPLYNMACMISIRTQFEHTNNVPYKAQFYALSTHFQTTWGLICLITQVKIMLE